MRREGGSPPAQPDLLFPADAAPQSIHRVFFWCVILGLGALQAWARRNEMSPDGISYIEIAWAAARGGLHQIVSGYWSPFYPFLLSLVFRTFHVPVQWEFTAAHVVNFAIYVASLAAFEQFLSELILLKRSLKRDEESTPVSEQIVWTWGYVFFLWASYFWLHLGWVTPDLCVAVIVYSATALLFRVRRGAGSWWLYTGLGALLGLGYLAKAAMFPLSFVFLLSAFGVALVAGTTLAKALIQTALAGGMFLGIALTLILPLSAAKGRMTFGDSGGIAYTEYIDGAPRSFHWQGEPAGTGTPLHATRKIHSDPAVYEFAAPIPGSYPPWYDPSYWYAGVRPHFLLKGQLLALYRASNLYLKIFSKSGALWVVLVGLVVAGRKNLLRWGRYERGAGIVILPSVAALAMYAIVLVEFRYVAPFALMSMTWAVARIRIVDGADERWLKRFYGVMILAPVIAFAWPAERDLYDVARNKPYAPWIVAQRLREMGMEPGTPVGSIGSGGDAYWAHLAGVRIIVEVPYTEEARFISADGAKRLQVLELFSSVGARAVITKRAEAAKVSDGWKEIPGTGHFVWMPDGPAAALEKR